MDGLDKITAKITELMSKVPKSKKDLIIEGGKLGKDLIKNISKKFNKKTGRQILSLPKKTPSKTKQINKRAENLKKKKSKSKALVPVKNNKLMNMNYSDFMKMPINKQSRALTVTNKTKSNTGTSIVPKPNTNVVKKQNRNIVTKQNRDIVKKNNTTQKPKISTTDLRRKGALATLNLIKKDGVKLGPPTVYAPEIDKPKKKKETPKVLPKLRPPKAEKPKTSKVTKETLPKVVKKKRSNITQRGKPTSSYDAQYTYDMLKKKGGKEFAKGRMSKENFAKVKKYSAGTQGKTIAGLKDLPSKSENPGIHMLPAKAKMNMGFKPMFGGGLVSSFYDKPEKVEKYKGNTSVARQVKGYGKAQKKT